MMAGVNIARLRLIEGSSVADNTVESGCTAGPLAGCELFDNSGMRGGVRSGGVSVLSDVRRTGGTGRGGR